MKTSNYKSTREKYPYTVWAKDTGAEWQWIAQECSTPARLLVPKSVSGSNAKFGFKNEMDAVAFKLKFGNRG